MATVKYRIRGKGNNPVSIYLYLSTGRGNFLETSTGFTVIPKDWSKITNKPKQTTPENKITFSELGKLEKFIYDGVNTAQGQGQLIDGYWLKDQINKCFDRVKKTDHSLLINHTQYIIDNANTRKVTGKNKIGLSERTVKGYNTFLGMITRYQKEIKKQIHFQDLNKSFVDRLVNWLINTENYAINTAGKYIENLKAVCADADKMSIKVNPYVQHIKSFKEQNEDRYIITLSFEELEQIRTAELETEAQENARKWLLLGCEIGQRAGDLLKLTPDNIRYDQGQLVFDIEQEKTKKYITAPVPSTYVQEIVENHFPYPISQQKLNKHIKQVCKLAKIEEKIKGKKYDKKSERKKTSTYPKWQLITSHTFRRSFATNYYKKIATPVLINITGHSKESMFLEYINRREDQDHNSQLFMKMWKMLQQDKEPQMRVIKNAANN